ncbi:hypothetical protein [Halalkalibacter nanhaiisediminis]|uniref:Uncharacterized protein n=1 Tax=Halalkalibacter nanhaiisediminis TaxID=688079 RepID=A0A562QQA1_9BACI|nr:hypothetical protein [Halalkalibacter nanhaiisediminis]TWI58914.1 hypothetical protein IQ10_00622 [Halalkalibacter nanhaiisediminis]
MEHDRTQSQQKKTNATNATNTTHQKEEKKYTGDKKLGGPNRPAE